MMNKTLSTLLSSTLLLTMSACDPEEPITEANDRQESFRDFDENSYWAEVVCDVNGDCWGRATLSPNLWTQVWSQCAIKDMIADEILLPDPDVGWHPDTCAPEKKPSTTPHVACYKWYPGSGQTICYGGDDGWMAIVHPSCDQGRYDLATWWGEGSCINGSPGDNSDYDYVLANQWVVPSARAFEATDAFDVVPTCSLWAGVVQMEPYECL